MIDGNGASRAHEGLRSSSPSTTSDVPARPAAVRVLLAVHDPALQHEVLDFLEREPLVTVVGAVDRADALFRTSDSVKPDATVTCPTIARDVRHPAAVGHMANLLVVAEEMTVPVLRESIEAGANAVFAWPEERQELARTIRAAKRERVGSSAPRGRVVAVFGAKGGSGATFVACHLAAAFADAGLASILVDLDVVLGDTAFALGVDMADQGRTIADLVPVMGELTEAHVEDALHRHPRGFGALLAPADPSEAERITSDLPEALVPVLAAAADVVVLHVARNLDGVTGEALSLADEVVLLVTSESASWRSARRVLDILGRRDRSPNVHLVLNAAGRGSSLRDDVERVVGRRPVVAVRFDPAVGRAMERGQVLPARSRGAFRDMRELATHLVPAPLRSSDR